MALSVTAQITGQEITTADTYGYMYEPLKVNIEDNGATAIFANLIVLDTETDTIVEELDQYGKWDISDSVTLTVDLMKIIRQYHDANVYQISNTSELADASEIVVSKYRYQFLIYSDITTDSSGVRVTKLPLLGGRDYYDFTPSVLQTQSLTEAELYGVTLSGRWKNYPNIVQSLADPTATDATPTITVSTESTADLEPCGGMLIWKSRFGGWMYWGMDISVYTPSGKIGSQLSSGMFEATSSGNPYIQANYSTIDYSYKFNLKAMALNVDELKAVSGIAFAPIVYYMRDATAKMELMELTSSSAPVSTLIGGGDFSVSLQSISSTSHKVR